MIDDRLIGAIIIGVGLSMVNYENDALKNYYDLNSSDDEEKQGYLYSYVYPGINKFLQAEELYAANLIKVCYYI